jgi:tRNA nucleotidyltransferase (CCA-adding enzyme)
VFVTEPCRKGAALSPGWRQNGRMDDDRQLAERIAQNERLRPVLDAAPSAAAEQHGVYLVGGTVRDLLLGEPGFDVDLAVEGDGQAFARALAAELGGRLKPHDAFGTAVVEYGDGERVDVVTARRESYSAPAALPTVEASTIEDDLFRRDFTINAMAAALAGPEAGSLVDPFEGRRDLEAKTIRVLHDRSFVDDPTRIFRALRYASRYGFELDEHTAALAREAIEAGLVGRLSPARLRDELVLLLDEPGADRAFALLQAFGADRAVHPALAADETARDMFLRLLDLRDRYGLGVPSWRLGLAALARDVPEPRAWLDDLKLRRQDARAIEAAVTTGPKLAEELREQRDPAEVVALAEPHPPDAALFALALEDVPALHEYFERLRNVRLEVDGADLAELGLAESPRVGEVLSELRRRKLNGELDGRDSELAAAKELIAQ